MPPLRSTAAPWTECRRVGARSLATQLRARFRTVEQLLRGVALGQRGNTTTSLINVGQSLRASSGSPASPSLLGRSRSQRPHDLIGARARAAQVQRIAPLFRAYLDLFSGGALAHDGRRT